MFVSIYQCKLIIIFLLLWNWCINYRSELVKYETNLYLIKRVIIQKNTNLVYKDDYLCTNKLTCVHFKLFPQITNNSQTHCILVVSICILYPKCIVDISFSQFLITSQGAKCWISSTSNFGLKLKMKIYYLDYTTTTQALFVKTVRKNFFFKSWLEHHK